MHVPGPVTPLPVEASSAPRAPLPPTLSRDVSDALEAFVETCRSAFGPDLRAVVLHGSAAEGRLRVTSDVNVVVVLRAFDAGRAAQLRTALRTAEAVARLSVMFLLESEIPAAAQAFAVKFEDLRARRVVLHGDDPFANLRIPRAAAIARLQQVSLNLGLRLRHAHVARGTRAEQLAREVASAAGALRSAAHVLLELEGSPASSPREAFERVARELGGGDLPALMVDARADGLLPAGVAEDAVLRLSELSLALHARASRLETES